MPLNYHSVTDIDSLKLPAVEHQLLVMRTELCIWKPACTSACLQMKSVCPLNGH